MPDPNRIFLTRVPSELISAGLSQRPVHPRPLWEKAVSGAFPAQQADNGRWSVSRADLPLVAAALGLQPAVEIAAA